MKFKYDDEVLVIKGFHRERKGQITDHTVDAFIFLSCIRYLVSFGSPFNTAWINEKDLKLIGENDD